LALVSAIAWVACGGAAPMAASSPVVARHAPPAIAPGTFWEDTPTEGVRLSAPKVEPSDKVGPDGVAVAPRNDHERSFGARYVALARQRVPFVVTMDALFSIAVRAVECALAEVDDGLAAASLTDALERTGERLTAESRAARSDTADAYALARGIVAVGRKLLDPSIDVGPTTPAADAELAKILAHAGPAKSPLLGRVLDYGAFDTQAGLAFGDARLPRFRAAAWVAHAPLALAREDGLDVATARTQARAAVLLTRATNDAWTHLARLRAFTSGEPDDPGPEALARIAQAMGFDLRDEQGLGNVVRIDKLRAALLRAAGPTVEDTGGSIATFRLLSPSAPADARALAAAATPGKLPSALDVGAALGATDLAEDPARRHASLHASMLDAIATYLAPSAIEAGAPWSTREAFRKRKIDVALAAWAELRHAEVPFARRAAREAIDEPEIAFDDARGAIEPAPEAIARLVSFVRQAKRGLASLGSLHETGAAARVLDAASKILESSLHIAEAQGRAPLSPELARALATLPSRIASLERRLGPAASPEVVVTAADLASGRVLEDAAGEIEDVWLLVDTGGVASAFAGAAVPFYERTVTLRSNDTSFARQLAESPR
jgi:hypothetical protein